VKLVQDIVFGKSGYLLEVGGERYWVEPQRELGTSDGVTEPSCPDFLIWPANSRSIRRPIAVFCDGWAYHQSSLRDDARKRSALVASGRFWVWSVTHDDVKAALAGETITDLESPLTALNRHGGGQAPASVPRAEPQAFSRNAVAQLLKWLAHEAGDGGDPVVSQLKRNATWATFLMVPPPGTPEAEAVNAEMAAVVRTLPEWMQEVPKPSAPATSRDGAHPLVRFWWPAAFSRGAMDLPVTPGLIVLNETDAIDETTQHGRWRRWLALFNTFQSLPGLLLATDRGLEVGDYGGLAPAVVAAHAEGPAATLGNAWVSAFQSAVEDVAGGLHRLADAGVDIPEIGYEYADNEGVILAEAELAWPRSKVCVLLDSQTEFAGTWATLGWRAVPLSDGWAEVVLQGLNEGLEIRS
jgi:DEAD/DEAH box helicase domain-containing protein